jgi:hypothetical protein
MTGGGGSPQAGALVLQHRALLQEELARAVEHEHMHGPVPEPSRVDFGPRRAVDHAIHLVHHIEEFVHVGREKAER